MIMSAVSTEATKEEITAGVKDEFGVVYSTDGKRLLECQNKELVNYDIKQGTEVICEDAFVNSEALQNISIPDSVVIIGHNPFCGDRKLQIKSNSLRFIVKDDMLIDSRNHNLISYTGNAESVELPNSVTTIGEYALCVCSTIKHIVIPDSVTCIEFGAFMNCGSLQHITIPDTVTSIGGLAFMNCCSLQQITIPASLKSIEGDSLVGCENIVLKSNSTRFVINKGMLIDNQTNTLVLYVGNNESITIPDTVTSIGDNAFLTNEYLCQITIPNSVTKIGMESFKDCSSLSQITIPNSVTSIGVGAFEACVSLRQITIPDSVTSIGSFAFWRCNSLQEINIPASVASIGKDVFEWCNSVRHITIPENEVERFKCLLPKELHNKLYYMRNGVKVNVPDDDVPF